MVLKSVEVSTIFEMVLEHTFVEDGLEMYKRSFISRFPVLS